MCDAPSDDGCSPSSSAARCSLRVVVGSGIAAQTLSPGATGLELLENAAATGAGLFAIILMFGPVSGAHLNPVVSLVDAAFGGMSWRDAAAYLPAQVAGCVSGAVLANLMFAQRGRLAVHQAPRDAARTSCPRSSRPRGSSS